MTDTIELHYSMYKCATQPVLHSITNAGYKNVSKTFCCLALMMEIIKGSNKMFQNPFNVNRIFKGYQIKKRFLCRSAFFYVEKTI